MRDRATRWVAALAGVAALVALTGCSGSTSDDDGPLVLASFYPMQFVTEQVGGPAVEVESLTPAGADPHSVELSPGQVVEIGDADLVVYSSGMQPAVEDAIAAQQPAHLVDAVAAAGLAGGDSGTRFDQGDPHFWLDPTLLQPLARQVSRQLAEIVPAHAEDFAARAEKLVAQLDELDGQYRSQLADCRAAVLVTSHEAFGYLADRYGLRQEGIAGIDPQIEPSPARVREVGRIVRENEVRTLYFGTNTSQQVTAELADALGVGTAVLDPLETPPESGGYLSVMAQNLDSLASGLNCEDG